MKKEWLVKNLAICIVVLFIGVGFKPMLAENTILDGKQSDYNNVDFEEAKEYLFQTIIKISNNPKVKEFLNENKHNLITNYYDCKNAIQKIYSKNPKLLKSILFTKPEMTYEYLEKGYKNGLEIFDILGVEETSKMMESAKITNLELFNELKIIIENDKELSNRISVLEEMNNNLKSNLGFQNSSVICKILNIIALMISLSYMFFGKYVYQWLVDHNRTLIAKTLAIFIYSIAYLAIPVVFLQLIFNCIEFPVSLV